VQSAQAALAKAQEGAETARQARDRQKRLVESYTRDEREIPVMLLPGAESAAKIAETKATQNAQRIVALGTETGILRQTLPIRQSGRNVAGGLKDAATESETAAQIAEAVNQGREKEMALRQQVLNAIRTGNGVKDDILVALKAQETQNVTLRGELKAATERIRSLENTRSAHPM
jgi:hypothetical protein